VYSSVLVYTTEFQLNYIIFVCPTEYSFVLQSTSTGLHYTLIFLQNTSLYMFVLQSISLYCRPLAHIAERCFFAGCVFVLHYKVLVSIAEQIITPLVA
jgi:hypothetical protein